MESNDKEKDQGGGIVETAIGNFYIRLHRFQFSKYYCKNQQIHQDFVSVLSQTLDRQAKDMINLRQTNIRHDKTWT